MIEWIKSWARKHKKGIIITCGIVAVVGTIAILVINGKKVEIPVKELADEIIPEMPKAIKPLDTTVDAVKTVAPQVAQAAEDITLEVNGVLKTFPRSEFIRQLHEGWHASAEKLAQAAELGIDLKPGETLVNACTVTMHAA